MASMVASLLWYDDDARTPLARKIAEAAQRYRERVGLEPTLCEMNEAQLASLNAPAPPTKARRRTTTVEVVVPPTLRLVPCGELHPNYLRVGIAEGEKPRPARPQPDAARPTRARKAAPLPPRAAATTRTPKRAPKRAPARASAPAPAPVATPAPRGGRRRAS